MRQRAAGVALVILGVATAPGAKAEWTSRGASPPRKIVVATTMYNIYGEHPGVERRLADAESLVDEAAAEARRR